MKGLVADLRFMMIGKAEKAGSGADKIISGWKEANKSAPKLEEKDRPEKVVLTLPLVSVLDDSIKLELVSLFGDQVLQLEHDKLLTLAFALTEGVVSNERLRFSFNKHKFDISKMLKELCVDGYLVSDGIGRGTTYQLNKQQNLTSSDANLTSSDANLTSSEANHTSSEANHTSLGANVATSSHMKKTKRKCSQKELFDLIVECASDWKSLEEISHNIDRSSQYLKTSIIKKMVSEGLLQRKYPMRNHPAQKYKRTDKSGNQ